MRRDGSKNRCLRCEDPEEETGKHYSKKMRTRYTEPVQKFMAPSGIYDKCMQKMLYHKALVIHSS